MRKSEALGLQWRHVDATHGYLRLPTSKTGAKRVPVGESVIGFLSGLPQLAGNPFVFPGRVAGKPFVGLSRVWERLRLRAGLDDVRLHDLRHSFEAAGASSGSSLLLLGSILGHRDPKTTQRYAHLARDPVRAAADQVSGLIAAALDNTTSSQSEFSAITHEVYRTDPKIEIVRKRTSKRYCLLIILKWH